MFPSLVHNKQDLYQVFNKLHINNYQTMKRKDIQLNNEDTTCNTNASHLQQGEWLASGTNQNTNLVTQAQKRRQFNTPLIQPLISHQQQPFISTNQALCSSSMHMLFHLILKTTLCYLWYLISLQMKNKGLQKVRESPKLIMLMGAVVR